MKKIIFTILAAASVVELNAQFGTFLDGGAQNGFTFSDVRSIGLGNFDATTPTTARLHLRNSLMNQPTATGFNGALFRTDGYNNVSNSWKLFTETGGTFSEIFKLEAPASTTDFLLQTTQTTGNMLFNTGGANQRGIITSAGLFGINTATPANRLHITSGSGDPYFGSTNGSSGLRLTNLINTTSVTALSNPTGLVLSVDGNGDVVLVGTSPSGTSAVVGQNGLSNFNPSTIELGGDAANPTQVTASALLTNRDLPLNGFNMQWFGAGKFNINSVNPLPFSPSAISKFNLYNSDYQAGIYSRTDASAFSNVSFGAYLENFTANSLINTGIQVTSNGNAESGAGIFNAFTTSSAHTSYGVQGTATGGVTAQAGHFESAPDPSNPSNTQTTFGVIGQGNDGTSKTYGVFGAALGNAAPLKYGVYGVVPNTISGTKSYGVLGEASSGAGVPVSGADVYGVFGRTMFGDNNYSVYGQINGSSGNKGFCVYGDASNPGSYGEIYAGYFKATSSSSMNVGVHSEAGGSGNFNVGVHTKATGSGTFNAAVYASANGSSTVNVGVYAQAPINMVSPTPGPPLTAGTYAGYFDGDVFVSGTLSSPGGAYVPSDQRIKKDVQDIENASALLSKIKPKTYHLTNSNVPQLKLDEQRLQYGVIAQELEQVMPELVKEAAVLPDYDKDHASKNPLTSIKSVNYIELIPVLIAAMNEQKKVVDDLKQQVADLQTKVDAQTGSNSKTSNIPDSIANLAITLSDKNLLVLNQNVPNPFAENTTIGYNIPEQFTSAQLVFSTTDGAVIKSMKITETGRGTVTVFANDLSHGMYSYSLIIDGKIIDTKKMVKE